MTIDGCGWDVPDAKENAAEFGYAGTGGDAESGAGFPKARVVTISECASHAEVAAVIGPVTSKGSGEQSLLGRCIRGWKRTGWWSPTPTSITGRAGGLRRAPGRRCWGG